MSPPNSHMDALVWQPYGAQNWSQTQNELCWVLWFYSEADSPSMPAWALESSQLPRRCAVPLFNVALKRRLPSCLQWLKGTKLPSYFIKKTFYTQRSECMVGFWKLPAGVWFESHYLWLYSSVLSKWRAAIDRSLTEAPFSLLCKLWTFKCSYQPSWASLGVQWWRIHLQGTRIHPTCRGQGFDLWFGEDSLEKEMAIGSSILA